MDCKYLLITDLITASESKDTEEIVSELIEDNDASNFCEEKTGKQKIYFLV